MPNNLVVQLLLKTGTFSTDLKQAGGQVQNFKNGCQTAGRTLDSFGKAIGVNIGSIAKLGGAAGAAVMAFNGFKSVMMSTQTTADAFDGAIAGAKGVVEAFKVSLATADFSTFQNGLWGVFDAAKAARDALDDLQDAQWGYGMMSSKNRRGFTEAQTAYKEAETAYKNAKTQADRDKYKAEMDRQKSIMAGFVTDEEKNARNFQYKNLEAIRSSVRARNTNIQEKDVTSEIIYRAAEIVNSINSKEEREKVKRQAAFIKSEAKKYATDSKREQYYAQHQDILILNALLEMKDEQIKAVAAEIQAGEDARTSAASMRKSYDRTTRGEVSQTPRTTSTPKVGKVEEVLPDAESLNYWKKILSEETKYRDNLVKDTDEWKLHNDKVNEAAAKIKEIEGVEEKREKNIEGSLNYYKELLNTLTQQRDALDPDTEEWDKLSRKIVTVEQLIGQIQMMTQQFNLDTAMSVQPPTISSLQNIVSILKQMRDNAPIGSELFDNLGESIEYFEKLLGLANKTKVEAPKTDTWNEFNQAMANTSTIVSSLTSTFKENSEVTTASILQMVSTALPAIGSLISSISALTAAEAVEAGVAATGKAVSTSKHWIEAIAAVAALGAVVAAAISAASKPNIQRFANGGIVGGSSFTGDRIPAQVNSGEMILNRTQQANLFNLANGGGTGKEVTFHISGTDLVGVMSNVNRKNRVIR